MLAKTTLVLMLRQGTMAEDFEEFVLGVAPNGPQAQKIREEIEAELSRVRKATGAAWVGVGPDGTAHLPRKESVQTALHKYGLADRFIYPDAKIEVDEVLLFGDLAALDALCEQQTRTIALTSERAIKAEKARDEVGRRRGVG